MYSYLYIVYTTSVIDKIVLKCYLKKIYNNFYIFKLYTFLVLDP